MRARIHVLDDALADQIAAGEVVERPASVVKELLENALDADARRIEVEIEQGGSALIAVADDGTGMDREDVGLAVRRHATSKIRSLEDLNAIATLGFRGEALPSIASVSRFELTSRPADAEEGTRLRIDGGDAPRVEAIGRAVGTTVRVSDLFFNVPARRKFLKATSTESAHVSEVCRRAALAHPGLHLSLRRDGRRSAEYLPAATLEARAKQALGAEPLNTIEGERDGVRVLAMLGAPERARSGAGGLYTFVNRRAVRDRALSRAVAFAYGSVLPPGRYPNGVVHMTIAPDEVDVNVHPQKSEVRFARTRDVLDAITKILAAGLGTSAWSGPAARGPSFWEPAPAAPAPTASSPIEAGPDPWGLAPTSGGAPAANPPTPYGAAFVPVSYANDAERDPALFEPTGFFGSLKVLGQARRMLIVCEGPRGLHIIDQHAADERVRYDGLRRAHREQRVAVQGLLVPQRVELSEADVALCETHKETLRAAGLDVVPIGERTVAVHGIPALVRRAPPERLVRDVLVELERQGERAFSDAIDMALATMACHGAIRAGDPLSNEECRELLRAMDAVEDFGGHCPHGRPVVHSIELSELERRLGR
ncbi:MAG: DNA mismatch repair endonuclease MutL [Sandaracinaceae bacterium]